MSSESNAESKNKLSPADAVGMLQAALEKCLELGIPVKAGNVEGRGLVIVVPGAALADNQLILREVSNG